MYSESRSTEARSTERRSASALVAVQLPLSSLPSPPVNAQSPLSYSQNSPNPLRILGLSPHPLLPRLTPHHRHPGFLLLASNVLRRLPPGTLLLPPSLPLSPGLTRRDTQGKSEAEWQAQLTPEQFRVRTRMAIAGDPAADRVRYADPPQERH